MDGTEPRAARRGAVAAAAVVGVVGTLLMSVPSVAAMSQPLYFASESPPGPGQKVGYQNDLGNDPGATVERRAPRDSLLRPVPGKPALATSASSSAIASPGAPDTPSFATSFQGAVSSICVVVHTNPYEVVKPNDPRLPNTGVVEYKFKLTLVNADGTRASTPDVTVKNGDGNERTSLVLPVSLTLAANATLVFHNASGELNSILLHYGDQLPSYVRFNGPCDATPSPTPSPSSGMAATVTDYTGPSSVTCGAKPRLTATVREAAGSPGSPATSGRVTFTLDRMNVSANLGSDGVAAAASVVSARPGTHSIRAAYSGTARWAASNDSASVSVTRGTSRTTLSGATVSGKYRLTAKVLSSGGAPVAGAKVTFARNGRTLGSATTNSSGTAALSTSAVKRGDSFTAKWSGNPCVTGSSATLRK